MKNIFVILFLLQATFIVHAQSGSWVWVRGSDTSNAVVTYPVQGIADTATNPPALYGAANWIDLEGNFWIFGGYNNNLYSDLWKYNPQANLWTWVKGSGIASQNGIYGIRGVSSATNMPGARDKCATWTDGNGDLWLFGGVAPGIDANWNDLWKYNIANNEWTWMNGDPMSTGDTAVYGIFQNPSELNGPGGRYGVSTWIDDNNNLWLFEGVMAYSFDFPVMVARSARNLLSFREFVKLRG